MERSDWLLRAGTQVSRVRWVSSSVEVLGGTVSFPAGGTVGWLSLCPPSPPPCLVLLPPSPPPPPPLGAGPCCPAQTADLIYFSFSPPALLPPLCRLSLQHFVPSLSLSLLQPLAQSFFWRERCDREEQEAEGEQLGPAGGREASTGEVMSTLTSSLLSPLLLPFLPLFSQLQELQKTAAQARGEEGRRGGPSRPLSPDWGGGVGGAYI